MENLPPDHFIKAFAFTPRNYTDVYPAINPTQPSFSQEGKVIIITGASRGIGSKAFAESFAHARPKALILLARSASNLASVADTVRAISPTTTVLPLSVDIGSASSVAAAFDSIRTHFPDAPTVLINNAGVSTGLSPLRESDPATWWSNHQINSLGTFLVTRQFLQLHAPERLADPASGITIVNVTSGAALINMPGDSGYGLSKLTGLVLAAYTAGENAGVTAVAMHPGIVKSDMVDINPHFARFANDTPALVGGFGVWLASGDKRYLNGRYVHANWDVEGLEARKEEILKEDWLKMGLRGPLGMDQFENKEAKN